MALTSTRKEEGSGAFTRGPSNRLVDNGLLLAPRVSLAADHGDATTYCIRATHENLPGHVIYISSETGVPSTEPCM